MVLIPSLPSVDKYSRSSSFHIYLYHVILLKLLLCLSSQSVHYVVSSTKSQKSKRLIRSRYLTRRKSLDFTFWCYAKCLLFISCCLLEVDVFFGLSIAGSQIGDLFIHFKPWPDCPDSGSSTAPLCRLNGEDLS